MSNRFSSAYPFDVFMVMMLLTVVFGGYGDNGVYDGDGAYLFVL